MSTMRFTAHKRRVIQIEYTLSPYVANTHHHLDIGVNFNSVRLMEAVQVFVRNNTII